MFLLQGTGIDHLPRPFVLQMKKLRPRREVVCPGHTNKQQHFLKVDRWERRYITYEALTLMVEGELMPGELAPRSSEHRMTSSKLLVKHHVLFWALYLMEDVDKLECDQEDGQTSSHAI